MSPTIIRRTMLAELAAYGAGITAAGLLELVRAKLPRASLADMVEELGWLRDHGMVACTPSPLDPDDRALRLWGITAAGALTLKA